MARESSPNRPTTGRDRRKAPRSPIHSIPDLPKAGGTRGQSPKLEARRQTRSGTRRFRRASVRRESHADRLARGAEKHAGEQRTASAMRERSARAGHRSDWVLVRGSRSVEVDETCLSRQSGHRACAAARGRDSAGFAGVRCPRGPRKRGRWLTSSKASHSCEGPGEGARDGQALAGSSDKGAMQTRVTHEPDSRGCRLDEESRISPMEGVLGSSRSSL